MRPDDFEYALENTRVLLAPQQRIRTFGSTTFRFHLLTEAMDRPDQIRIRRGTIEAEKPALFTPENAARLLLEGFGERAEAFAEALRQIRDDRSARAALLRYGFQVRKSEVVEDLAHGSLEELGDRVCRQVANSSDDLAAVLLGVEDGWEVGLVKFTLDLVAQSGRDNLDDFRRRGLV
ncbi:MAG: hypothetical protein JSR82_01460 [Verrucomicrobia bacterium]|nr:hypothetical protein [Verrucomicrobiota bacterium]